MAEAEALRWAVFSDSHGNADTLLMALHREMQAGELQGAFFLGDGVYEALRTAASFPALPFYIVRGNNDLSRSLPAQAQGVFGDKTVFYAHGHGFGVKQQPFALAKAAKDRGADIALFGHTHLFFWEKIDGVWLGNPGSLLSGPLRPGSYGVLEIAPGKEPAFLRREVE